MFYVKKVESNPLYTLIPLEDLKSILGIDDRVDKLARFCLVTATFTIEQYCKRRFLRKKHFERIEYNGDLLLSLREYPVTSILAAYTIKNEQLSMNNGDILEPEFYSVIPDCGTDYDFPFDLSLSRAIQRYSGISKIKVVYWAGYSKRCVPSDLATACLELASWNMNRYRGRRVGMTGNIRGAGKEGEHFEMSMPENVKVLLEPYRRKTI
jgi:hypothetical protein